MILSHTHKFIFIKGKKVGGTSAEIALSQVCGRDDIITPITPRDERHRLRTEGEPRNYTSHLLPPSLRRAIEQQYIRSISTQSTLLLPGIQARMHRFWNHMDLGRVLRLVPEAADYRILCVERSPYAKVLSLANWDANQVGYTKGEQLPQSAGAIADAVERLFTNGDIRSVLNIGQYRDGAGNVRAVPWKTDTLAYDLDAFVRSLGIEPIRVVHAKRGFGSGTVNPSSMLNSDQIDTINRIFVEEFAAFGWPMLP